MRNMFVIFTAVVINLVGLAIGFAIAPIYALFNRGATIAWTILLVLVLTMGEAGLSMYYFGMLAFNIVFYVILLIISLIVGNRAEA